ncbi:MAG: hypothetical protein WHT84_09555, partial [Breznakiellaceae bacterium]
MPVRTFGFLAARLDDPYQHAVWNGAADAARQGTTPLPADDLDDPWGRGDQCFSRVADEIEET